jgi:hypothetical protein
MWGGGVEMEIEFSFAQGRVLSCLDFSDSELS